MNINQLKIEVHDAYRNDEKSTTNFEADNAHDVINNAYLDEELTKIHGHLSFLEKDYNGFKLQYNKQSVKEILIQRAVKTTIQILYNKGLFDKYNNADEILKDFLFVERRRPDLEKVNESEIQ